MEKLEARENGEQTITSHMSNPTRKKIKKLFLRRLKISIKGYEGGRDRLKFMMSNIGVKELP